MGTLRLVDNYVTELISALRKAFEVTHKMTQMEALRQKWRYDQKASTLNTKQGGCSTGEKQPVCREEKTKGPLG